MKNLIRTSSQALVTPMLSRENTAMATMSTMNIFLRPIMSVA